jgi:hypothetical protein
MLSRQNRLKDSKYATRLAKIGSESPSGNYESVEIGASGAVSCPTIFKIQPEVEEIAGILQL